MNSKPTKNKNYELPGRENRRKNKKPAKSKPSKVRKKKEKKLRQSAFGSMFQMKKPLSKSPRQMSTRVEDVFRTNVLQTAEEIEKNMKNDLDTEEVEVELPLAIGANEWTYLMLPFLNSLIVGFGVIKDKVMIPTRLDGLCYVDEKVYQMRDKFKTDAEYCAQVNNAFYFFIPVGIQFLAIFGYLLMRQMNRIRMIQAAVLFEALLVSTEIFLFELIEIILGFYHFMNGILLIWLVGFTFRLKWLTFDQKLLMVVFQNVIHALILMVARYVDNRNGTSISNLGRTIFVPFIYSVMLWKLNNEQTVRQSFYNEQAKVLQLKVKVLKTQLKNTEQLLECVLPKEIIPIVKDMANTKSSRYCVSYDKVTILFAKITGVHEMFEELPTVEVVGQLDRLFKDIDVTTDLYTIEKIKTVGDTYMCASGLPTPHPNHAYRMARFAFALGNVVKTFSENKKLNYKTGMCIGKIVAGVIGKTKFTYDIWGDAANTASRMYSHGVKGKIQCPLDTAEKIKDKFEVEHRGIQIIKGKGEMDCWFIVSEKAGVTDDITNVELNEYEKQNMKKENIRAKNSSKKKAHRSSAANTKLAKLLDENSATGSNKDALTVGKDGWVSDSEKVCQKCKSPFTLLNRRHHCRYCGMLLCQDCSKWKVQKLRACQDCKELYDEAKDQNEFLRQKEEKSKRDKIRRAKKNLVSPNPCKACCECIRSGTSREWEREYLDHKKEQIDKTLSIFWSIYMFIIMAYSTGLSFMMESSCLETPSFEVTPDGLFNDNRSPCKYKEAGQVRIGDLRGSEGFSLDSVSEDMNKSVLEFISMFSKFNNNSDLHLTDLKISGTDSYESAWRGQRDLVYSWSGKNNTRIFPGLKNDLELAMIINVFFILPLVVYWIHLSNTLNYNAIPEAREDANSRLAKNCCIGGTPLRVYLDIRQRIIIHWEQVVTTMVLALILILTTYQFFICHYWYGHMLLIALYGFNTYSLLTHGIIYIVTAICILIIVLTIPANIFGFNSQTYELREKLEFVVLFLVTVYHALVQGKSIDLSTRESFLKTKEISNLKDKSSTERKKNIAMLPLPDVITNGLQEGKNIVIDAYGTVLFADIVSFTVFSSSDVLAHDPEDRPKKLVEILNDMFSRHDALAERCEVDKVKTLGDCYVASCGLLVPIANHASTLTKFGIGMHGVMGELNDVFKLRGKGPKNKDLRIRVGLASGTVVGGVVGGKKFIFDIWGDTVEMAEVMESEGVPERVHISQTTYLRARKDKDLKFEERVNVDLSEFGYHDKSYIATPADLRDDQSIPDWISQIFPAEEKEEVEAQVLARNSSFRKNRGSLMSMDFVDNPMMSSRATSYQ
eukprot:g6113.t1